MKKITYTLIVLFAFIGIVNAEQCTVVTGTGKNIGDEIACGTEHFYIISNDGENAKMLAKYNIMTGNSFYKLKLENFTSSTYSGFYENEEVQQKLIDGWYVEDYYYNRDSTNNTYYNYEILLSKYDDWDSTAIFFDTTKSPKEIYEDAEVKAYLNNGYTLNYIYSASSDGYIGAYLGKYLSNEYEYKTIFLDSSKISYLQLYNNPNVKTLLDDGYIISNSPYNSCSTTSNVTSCDFYAVVLSKNIYYDSINIFADKEYASSTELIEYLKNNTDYQKYLDEGYNLDFYYRNNTGVSLYKNTDNEFQYPFKVLQNEKAIGAHGDEKGNPEPLEVGIIQLIYYYEYYDTTLNNYDKNLIYNDGYYDAVLDEESSDLLSYLNAYNKQLKDDGFEIIDMDMLTVKELNNLVKNITDKELPLTEWSTSWKEEFNSSSWEDYYIVGSIKEEIPENIRDKYSWIWSTTYWLKTIGADADNSNYYEYMYFVDTLGDLCSGYTCASAVGAGVRPVVTISSEDITYTITTKTDGNGTITPSVETEHSGNEVTFIVTPNEGFVLGVVKVTDSNGNTITFTDYKFTMPDANVVIEATFVPENPETTAINIIISIILGIISIGIVLKFKKKADWLNT